jgi:dTDP-4-amino-4,6-dideoxygalactose transaminase
MQIPFNRPYLTGNELKYITDVLDSLGDGGHISGDGKYTKKVQEFIQSRFGAKKALLTTSCTSALELATRLLCLKPGDEVIVPSYTFSSTVNPVLLVGARPVFAEIQEDTLNIDPEDIKRKITPRTKAIYPMHYAGVSCAMDEIMEMAQEHNLKVVEDAAQGVNGRYKGRYLGTIGDFGCYSFHETKNYTCGEGGALLINTDDPAIIERAEIIREKGTDRSKFFRGEVDKYTWVDIGSSYLLSDILAAFLYAQLEKLEEIQEKRMRIWQAYYAALKPLEERGRLRLPVIPDYADHNAHLFYILLKDERTRDLTIENLKKYGIHTVFHYIPLHTSSFGIRFGYKLGELPRTENISACLLRLPIYTGLGNEELQDILSVIELILEG